MLGRLVGQGYVDSLLSRPAEDDFVYRHEVLRFHGNGQAGPNFTKSSGEQGEKEKQIDTMFENLSKLMGDDVITHPAGTYSAGGSSDRNVRDDLANLPASSSQSELKLQKTKMKPGERV